MEEIKFKILWCAIEDFVGLWELVWELNTLLPHNSEEQNTVLVNSVLIELLNSKFIKIYINTRGFDDHDEVELQLSLSLLNNKENWAAPAINQKCLKCGCTELGKLYYDSKF